MCGKLIVRLRIQAAGCRPRADIEGYRGSPRKL
jgi:hypothetical protein